MLLLLLMTTNVPPDGTRDKNAFLEELIATTAKGDTKALETLYLHTKASVYGFGLSILKNHQNAEDVMQDAYVRLFQAAGGYIPQGKPMAWILTIVRNLALMKLRAQGSGEVLTEDLWAMPQEGDFTESSTDRMVLRAALQNLSDEERQIILLHSVSGLKHRETADILKLPLSTVLSKYRRALTKLRKIVEEGEQ